MFSPFAAAELSGIFEENETSLVSAESGLSASGVLDDLLLVPEHFPPKDEEAEAWSLDDLFWTDLGRESQAIMTPAGSGTSIRLAGLLEQEFDQVSAVQPQPLPRLAPSGLQLQLDYHSVAMAWGQLGAGRAAASTDADDLARVVSAISSMSKGESGLQDLSQDLLVVETSAGSDQPTHVRKAALERYRHKKAVVQCQRSTEVPKRTRYEKRRINAVNRPRIKGRFVKKCELECYMAQQVAVTDETTVPGH